MAIEKVASFTEGDQVGKPCPWNKTASGFERNDDRLWLQGRVHCPHSRTEKYFAHATLNCLRRRAQHEATDGVLVPFEEGKAS
jgi:hypothetical protein